MAKVQLAFLLDTTASMQGWIDACKDEIYKIIDNTRAKFGEDVLFETALVAYSDYEEDVRAHIIVVPFKDHPFTLRNTLQSIQAWGGNDFAEDVAGGLSELLHLEWKEDYTKLVVHLADAPPHGTSWHEPWVSDNYPNGDPGGIDLETVLTKIRYKINPTLTFFKINDTTDLYIQTLSSILGDSLIVADLKEQEYTHRGIRTRIDDLDNHRFSAMVSSVVAMSLSPTEPSSAQSDPKTLCIPTP
jgi:hypothetical protein